jgi:hypothetical protein
MSTLDLSKESKRKPAEVVTDIALSDRAVALLPDAENTLAFLDNLCEQGLFNDAFLTLARTLPKQYAIVWASKCVEESLDDDCQPEDRQCADVAKRWLQGPDEKIRREAMDAASARDYAGPCAWLAAAVGFSGGSLAPENQAEVEPPQHLTAVAISACLTGLAITNPQAAPEVSRHFIDQGIAMVAIPGSSAAGN